MTRSRIATQKELVDHLHQLSRAFHIMLRETDEPREHATARHLYTVERDDKNRLVAVHRSRDVVTCGRITTDCDYAIVMHEYGHILHPGGTLQSYTLPPNLLLKLDEERNAWQWARDHALDWTPGMEATRLFAFETYRQEHAWLRKGFSTVGYVLIRCKCGQRLRLYNNRFQQCPKCKARL